MFERFSPETKRLILEAQEQRLALAHKKVGSEHLLLALSVEEGPGGEALRRQGLDAHCVKVRLEDAATSSPSTPEHDDQLLQGLGIDVAKIRDSLRETFGPDALDKAREHRTQNQWRRRCGKQVSGAGGDRGRQARWDAKAKRVLEQSLREALRLRSKRIGPEHIGLGLLADHDNPARHLLADEGIDLLELRRSWEAVAGGTALH